MKKLIFGILIGICFTALIGAGIEAYTVSKKTAEVQIYQNIKVFTDCTPVMEYEYLGTIKLGISFTSGQYQPIRDSFIKSAKKQYPQCDGIILHFVDGGVDSADVIKFK